MSFWLFTRPLEYAVKISWRHPAHRTLTVRGAARKMRSPRGYVHQQDIGTHKTYSLVDCPIYSVVKYRPRQGPLLVRLWPLAKGGAFNSPRPALAGFWIELTARADSS